MPRPRVTIASESVALARDITKEKVASKFFTYVLIIPVSIILFYSVFLTVNLYGFFC